MVRTLDLSPGDLVGRFKDIIDMADSICGIDLCKTTLSHWWPLSERQVAGLKKKFSPKPEN